MTARSHVPESSATIPHQVNQRRWRIVFVTLVAAIPVVIGAWIVNANTQSAAVPAASCHAVGAALATGPDPDADPVGYAEAQVRPLRKIVTSDTALHAAILQLSSADELFYKDRGTSSSLKLLKSAERSVDHICPGATS